MVAIDMSAAKAPPAKRRAPGTRTQAVQTPHLTPTELRTDGLLGLAQLGQAVTLMLGQYADAAAIGKLFPPIAPELAKLANGREWLAKPIDFLIEIGPYGAFLGVALPFALQIAANHGWVDAHKLGGHGVVPPEVLDAQMRAQVAQLQAQALRQQQEAIREAQEATLQAQQMQQEWEAYMTEQSPNGHESTTTKLPA